MCTASAQTDTTEYAGHTYSGKYENCLMEEYKAIAAMLNQLPFDIRVEVVAADLMEQGIDPDKIIFRPASLFKRRFSKDIIDAKVADNSWGDYELHIDVTRDGIYDTLPQGIFHQPRSGSTFKRKSDMLANVKTTREEENNARKFFQPMENEMFHLRTAVERAERKIFFDLEHSETNELLIKFWRLESYRRYPTLPLLVKLMPIIYRLSANPDYIKICYELILRVPVSISIKHAYNDMDTTLTGWTLGKDALGFETIGSDRMMNEMPTYELTIGPIAAAMIPDYLPAGKMLPYLDLLNSYFLVAGYEINTTIIPHEQECLFDLSKEHLYLGLNLQL
jgi:hypothetical protein